MNPLTIGILGWVFVFVLIFAGIHIALALGVVGLVGIILLDGFQQGVGQGGMVTWTQSNSITLAAMPLYILMGELAFYSGIAGKFYDAMYAWFGRLPGGLAITTVFVCAGFAGVCGSSTATVAAVGAIGVPHMVRFNYNKSFAAATVAASGTLGILIPPSLVIILYGWLTDTSIGATFIAGILPGVMSAVIYAVMIFIRARLNPSLAPPGERFSWRERLASLRGTWGIALLFVLVMGGIYRGIYTPTEGAGIGAFLALVVCLAAGTLNKTNLWNAFKDTGRLTGMVGALVIGGVIFARFMGHADFVPWLTEFLSNYAGDNPYSSLTIVLLLFFVLGMFMPVMAMLILALPPAFALVVTQAGFDPVWFGIIIVKLTELALITPPIAMNVFVIAGMDRSVPIQMTFRSVFWFTIMDALTIATLIIFPQIVLFLPSTMGF